MLRGNIISETSFWCLQARKLLLRHPKDCLLRTHVVAACNICGKPQQKKLLLKRPQAQVPYNTGSFLEEAAYGSTIEPKAL